MNKSLTSKNGTLNIFVIKIKHPENYLNIQK